MTLFVILLLILVSQNKDRIYALEKQYKEELYEFYVTVRKESSEKDADEIFAEFDEKWDREHPEFYDMQRLLA